MEYSFKITQYNADTLVDEVAAALEKQVELNSRAKLPAIWSFIDKSSSRRADEGVIRRRKIVRKIYGIILLVLGIFLLLPGLMKPKELLLPLIVGIISAVIGILQILPWKSSKRKFRKIAEKLLAGNKKMVDEDVKKALAVHFKNEGMFLPNHSIIAYSDFQNIIETENIYFLVWQGKVTILQKKDLAKEKPEKFLNFLEKKTNLHRITI